MIWDQKGSGFRLASRDECGCDPVPRRRNPATARAEDLDSVNPDAVAKYREFHRFDPRQVGEFAASVKMPDQVHRLGVAKWVAYRSGKTDPETLKKPGPKGLDYIHHHDPGVDLYIPSSSGHAADTDVPGYVGKIDALTLLGACLEVGYENAEGNEVQVKSTSPLPELYAIPSGKALVIVQDKKEIVAIIWGGTLAVEDRGIVG